MDVQGRRGHPRRPVGYRAHAGFCTSMRLRRPDNLMHQGPPAGFGLYGDITSSAIKSRMTQEAGDPFVVLLEGAFVSTIRVQIPLVIEVDRDAWPVPDPNVDVTSRTVVDGVRAYVLSQLRQAPLLAPGKAAVTIKQLPALWRATSVGGGPYGSFT